MPPVSQTGLLGEEPQEFSRLLPGVGSFECEVIGGGFLVFWKLSLTNRCVGETFSSILVWDVSSLQWGKSSGR